MRFISLALLGCLTLGAENPKTAAPSDSDQTQRLELEKKFQESLTEAVLDGQWYTVKDGQTGEPKKEKYTIQGVSKTEAFGKDLWLINARIQYGDKDVTLPVPVKVKWAGDTPIISITDVYLPGLGTYTARLMVYNGLYAGTWFGPNVGGVFSGRIVKGEKDGKDAEKKKQGTEK